MYAMCVIIYTYIYIYIDMYTYTYKYVQVFCLMVISAPGQISSWFGA